MDGFPLTNDFLCHIGLSYAFEKNLFSPAQENLLLEVATTYHVYLIFVHQLKRQLLSYSGTINGLHQKQSKCPLNNLEEIRKT